MPANGRIVAIAKPSGSLRCVRDGRSRESMPDEPTFKNGGYDAVTRHIEVRTIAGKVAGMDWRVVLMVAVATAATGCRPKEQPATRPSVPRDSAAHWAAPPARPALPAPTGPAMRVERVRGQVEGATLL